MFSRENNYIHNTISNRNLRQTKILKLTVSFSNERFYLKLLPEFVIL